MSFDHKTRNDPLPKPRAIDSSRGVRAKNGAGIANHFGGPREKAYQIQIHNLRQIGEKTAKSCKNHPKSSFATILRLLCAPSLVVPLSTKTHNGALKKPAQSTELAEYVRKTQLESQIDSVGAEIDQISH